MLDRTALSTLRELVEVCARFARNAGPRADIRDHGLTADLLAGCERALAALESPDRAGFLPLVRSPHTDGRYGVGRGWWFDEFTSGDPIEVLVGDVVVSGRVEYVHLAHLGASSTNDTGYCFIADRGDARLVAPLREGMRVRRFGRMKDEG